ncbi:hypothetical protein OYC64_015255 [Pagothenia borchgrevinki]|uniref:Uncharacterized protein n=1 Tax=Pagothenia borchgrevinki TaxID=8213 RepID=A0ABD2HF82_PAGBO
MSSSSRKKASAAPDPKANSASPAKGAGAGPLAASAARGDETAILQAIQSLREDLLKKIDDNAEMQSKELRREISQLRSAVDRVSSRTKSLEDRLESLDTAANDHSDLITTLERDVQQIKKDMKIFSDRSEDLEARSRRCNLRITRIQEKRKAGKNPTDFVAKLLQETLGLEKEPLLDICHRTLRERPQEDQPPRAFVVRFHYYREKEAMLCKAATATDPTTSHGDRIRVFPDYTQAVAKQRAAFRDVKGMLRGCDGVKYGLWYPSVLRITTADGKRHSFTDPGEAKDFVLRNVAKQSG